MPYLELPDVRLYYEDSGGGGEPLLLIPGLATDSGCWAGCAARWGNAFRLLMPDPRGAGRTEAGQGTFTLRTLAADCAALLSELGIARAHVLGHSMGGMIAQEFALAFPNMVDKLILAGTGREPDAFVRAVVQTWAQVRQRGDDSEFFLSVLPWMVTRRYYNDPNRPKSALRYFLDYPYKGTLAGFNAQLNALLGRDARESLAVLRCPTLVVGGEEDLLFPPERTTALADAITGARLRLLPALAHSPMLEATAVFSVVVMEFLLEA